MLTIDWKERLTLDTEDYLKHKLPGKDYDFEIIFNAYPERVNGKVPGEVITYISGIIVRKIGKNHAEFIPFYKHLWLKKGDYGKLAFGGILAKIMNKEPDIYLPLLEEMIAKNGNASQVNALLDKVMLSLTRRYPDKYLARVFTWCKDEKPELARAATNLLVKLVRRKDELIPEVMIHMQSQWSYPLEELHSFHVLFLKTVAKLNFEAYRAVWQEFGISRDPQIVELLCSSLLSYHPDFEPVIEMWSKSGNARVKKAGLAAQKILKKKKGAKA